jgi:hypothetical protein
MVAADVRRPSQILPTHEAAHASIVAAAISSYAALCADLDTAERALGELWQFAQPPAALPPKPPPASLPAPPVESPRRYAAIERVAAAHRRRREAARGESPAPTAAHAMWFDSPPPTPPKPAAAPTPPKPALALPATAAAPPRPAAPPADGTRCARALRHLLLRDALARYRAGAHHAQEQLAYAVAAAPAELARVRLQCALARWAGAAASASAAARMRGALFETRRHDGLLRAVRRWLAWRRRALVWRQKSLRRVAAAGGPLRLHNDHMRTFDARGLFVEFGNAVMAKTWRERRRRAVVFCAWALATHADVLKADSVLDAFSLLGPSRA